MPHSAHFGIGYAMPNGMLMARTLASILMLLMSPGLIDTSAVNTATVVPVDREAMGYWTRWRGPSGQGTVADGDYPDTWSDTLNVKWKVDVPGRGHSSPIVWKDHIFLTTARDNGAAVSMLAFRRSDGRLLWETKVPTTGVRNDPLEIGKSGLPARDSTTTTPLSPPPARRRRAIRSSNTRKSAASAAMAASSRCRVP